jgi:hypothetical protein
MKNLMTTDGTSNNAELMCPMCGVEVGLHITKVEILTGKYSLVANSLGIKTNPEPSMAAVGNRGAIVKLGLACECCGHVGIIDFAFRKGMITVDCEDLGEDSKWSDLWRD